MSPPVGPTGIATTCQGDESDSRWHTEGSFGIFFSDLVIGNLSSVSIQREAVTASVDYRLSPETTFGGGVGAGLGGVISVIPQAGAAPQRFLILPGWEVTLAYSRRLLDGRGKSPFVVLGISGGASGARTEPDGVASAQTSSLYAFDIRAGLIVGKTFWNTLSPYAAVRAFGGPVIWSFGGNSEFGSDLYHFQLGGGLVTALARGFDVFVEGVPLGERAVTLGAGKTF